MAFVILFIADYLWFGVLFTNWLSEYMPGSKGPENIPLHAVGELCFAALLAYIYPIGYKGGSPITEGAKFGFLMGLVYSLPGHIHTYAAMGGAKRVACFFVANGIVMGIIGGIAVAKIYGNKSA